MHSNQYPILKAYRVIREMSTARKPVLNDDDFEDDAYDVPESTLLAPTHSDSDDGEGSVSEDSSEESNGEEEVGLEEVDGEGVQKEEVEHKDESKRKVSTDISSKKRQKVEALKKGRGSAPSSSSSLSSLVDAKSMLHALLNFEPEGPYNSLSMSLSTQNFIASIPKNGEFSQSHLRAFSSVFPSVKKALRLENLNEVGSPKALIVCSSASRATDIIKEISNVLKVKISKLYAKHFKVHQQVEMLQEKIVVGVGTPNRLNKLIEVGALSLSETSIFVIDSYVDSKSFTVFSLPEVKDDLYSLLRGNITKELGHMKLAIAGSL